MGNPSSKRRPFLGKLSDFEIDLAKRIAVTVRRKR